MIGLSIVDGDLLDARADAILLPIDGALPVDAGPKLVERALGRIARAFARRYPGCELADEIDAQVSFPIALGAAAAVELPEESPFRYALVLSVLPHRADQTGDDLVRAAAARALAQALEQCDQLGLATVAAPLLKAGWRVTTEAAMTLMLTTLASFRPRHPIAVEIRILDEPGAVAAMRDLARSVGIAAT
jgi:hypothetical protein